MPKLAVDGAGTEVMPDLDETSDLADWDAPLARIFTKPFETLIGDLPCLGRPVRPAVLDGDGGQGLLVAAAKRGLEAGPRRYGRYTPPEATSTNTSSSPNAPA